MLRKNQRRWCVFLVCILLMAAMHTTYVKADSFAKRAVAVETARIQAPEKLAAQEKVCVVENVRTTLRAAIGQATNRSSSIRRDLRLPTLFLCGLCVAYFILRCWRTEEILCLHEKKYRAALIKYIHDIDGKKRISCLT